MSRKESKSNKEQELPATETDQKTEAKKTKISPAQQFLKDLPQIEFPIYNQDYFQKLAAAPTDGQFANHMKQLDTLAMIAAIIHSPGDGSDVFLARLAALAGGGRLQYHELERLDGMRNGRPQFSAFFGGWRSWESRAPLASAFLHGGKINFQLQEPSRDLYLLSIAGKPVADTKEDKNVEDSPGFNLPFFKRGDVIYIRKMKQTESKEGPDFSYSYEPLQSDHSDLAQRCLTAILQSYPLATHPFLFKVSDVIYFYGRTHEGWQLTELNCQQARALKFTNQLNLLPSKNIPAEVFQEIVAKKAHHEFFDPLSWLMKDRATQKQSATFSADAHQYDVDRKQIIYTSKKSFKRNPAHATDYYQQNIPVAIWGAYNPITAEVPASDGSRGLVHCLITPPSASTAGAGCVTVDVRSTGSSQVGINGYSLISTTMGNVAATGPLFNPQSTNSLLDFSFEQKDAAQLLDIRLTPGNNSLLVPLNNKHISHILRMEDTQQIKRYAIGMLLGGHEAITEQEYKQIETAVGEKMNFSQEEAEYRQLNHNATTHPSNRRTWQILGLGVLLIAAGVGCNFIPGAQVLGAFLIGYGIKISTASTTTAVALATPGALIIIGRLLQEAGQAISQWWKLRRHQTKSQTDKIPASPAFSGISDSTLSTTTDAESIDSDSPDSNPDESVATSSLGLSAFSEIKDEKYSAEPTKVGRYTQLELIDMQQQEFKELPIRTLRSQISRAKNLHIARTDQLPSSTNIQLGVVIVNQDHNKNYLYFIENGRYAVNDQGQYIYLNLNNKQCAQRDKELQRVIENYITFPHLFQNLREEATAEDITYLQKALQDIVKNYGLQYSRHRLFAGSILGATHSKEVMQLSQQAQAPIEEKDCAKQFSRIVSDIINRYLTEKYKEKLDDRRVVELLNSDLNNHHYFRSLALLLQDIIRLYPDIEGIPEEVTQVSSPVKSSEIRQSQEQFAEGSRSLSAGDLALTIWSLPSPDNVDDDKLDSKSDQNYTLLSAVPELDEELPEEDDFDIELMELNESTASAEDDHLSLPQSPQLIFQ